MSGPPTRWSLAGRVSRHVLATVAAGWIATIGLAVWALNHEMNELFDAEMQKLAEVTALLLDSAEHGHGSDAIPRALGLSADNDEQMLRIYPQHGTPPLAPWPARLEDGFAEANGWRLYRQTMDETVIEIGHSRAWRREEVLEAANAFVILLLPLLALVVLVARRVVLHALRPVATFAGQVSARRPDDLSALPDAGLPREMLPLAQALNLYLDRIAALRVAERHFVANAAHELRTPLATARAQLDLGGAGAAQAAMATLDTLTRRVERLLQLARAEAGLGQHAGETDLLRVLHLVVEEISRPTGAKILLDDGDLTALPLRADADALAILLRNLIENAVQHGAGDVRLRLAPSGLLTLSNLVNEGAAFRPAPFDRREGSDGTGLGLFIAETLAQDLGLVPDWQIAEGRATVRLDFAPLRA